MPVGQIFSFPASVGNLPVMRRNDRQFPRSSMYYGELFTVQLLTNHIKLLIYNQCLLFALRSRLSEGLYG